MLLKIRPNRSEVLSLLLKITMAVLTFTCHFSDSHWHMLNLGRDQFSFVPLGNPPTNDVLRCC